MYKLQRINSTNILGKTIFFKNRNTSKICAEETKIALGCTPKLLKNLLENDEIKDIKFYIEQLSGSEHPLFAVAEKLLFKNELTTLGFIVLLLSKAAGVSKHVETSKQDTELGILHNQKVLAKSIELLNISTIIHKTVSNPIKTINDENKLSLLLGDYLISKIFEDIAQIKNSWVFSILGTTLRDIAESEFLLTVNSNGKSLPSKPKILPKTSLGNKNNLDQGPYNINKIIGNCKDEWILRNLLNSGNLLGKFCQASMILAEHSEHLQEQAYLFGKHLALAWQANIDYKAFQSDSIDLVSLPVMFHLQKHPDLYREIEKGLENTDKCNFDKIKFEVKQNSALKETKDFQNEYVNRALVNLSHFDDNKARTSLKNILMSLN